jgi:hypothetical protein
MAVVLVLSACKKDEIPDVNPYPTEVVPVDVNQEGFEFLEKIQGHWVGINKVMSWEFDWFAFDFRAISESHVLGMYEGGDMGNLLSSFFVSEYKGVRTIMVRNGGVLSGIYRSSYFVMDEVVHNEDGDYYRFVDALGGQATMFIEIRFQGQQMFFNAYTSRMGEGELPTRHMTYKGTRLNSDLAQEAASTNNFPKNSIAWDFSGGFNTQVMYIAPGHSQAQSATYMWQGNTADDVEDLAQQSGDPFTISDHPNIAKLQVDIDRNDTIKDDKVWIYLSYADLTNPQGGIDFLKLDSILQFPEISKGVDTYLFTYLHPGDYYLTVVADHNNDGKPSLGDINSKSKLISIDPESSNTFQINQIIYQN